MFLFAQDLKLQRERTCLRSSVGTSGDIGVFTGLILHGRLPFIQKAEGPRLAPAGEELCTCCSLGPLIGGPESGTSLGEPACAKSMSWG